MAVSFNAYFAKGAALRTLLKKIDTGDTAAAGAAMLATAGCLHEAAKSLMVDSLPALITTLLVSMVVSKVAANDILDKFENSRMGKLKIALSLGAVLAASGPLGTLVPSVAAEADGWMAEHRQAASRGIANKTHEDARWSQYKKQVRRQGLTMNIP